MTLLLIRTLLGKMQTKKGFTLIELLVVIVIIGILSAIALPTFLGYVDRSRQAEAKTYIAAASRAQQAYFNENAIFTENLSELGIGLSSQTIWYAYFGENTTKPLNSGVTLKAWSQRPSLRSFSGVVSISANPGAQSKTSYVLCNAGDYSFWSGGALIGEGQYDAVSNEPQCPINFVLD